MTNKNKWVCPNGCVTGHAADAPCPQVMAAAAHARLNWKGPGVRHVPASSNKQPKQPGRE